MVVHTWQYNTMHPKLELYYFNAVSSLYLEPLVNSIAHSGAGRLYADHRASTLVLPRRLSSSRSAKSRKSRLPTIGGALQAQSAKFTTPRLPLRRGTSTHAAVVRLVVGVPAGILMEASPRHALLPGQPNATVNPGQGGVGFLDPPYWQRRHRMTPMNVRLSRNESPNRDPSPACPCWSTLGLI